MSGNLLIVESPAKAKTIEKILGGDFTVKSCFGHIRDLSKKNNGVDVDNGYEPNYEVPEDKKSVVKELKKLSKGAEVWLATDEDREGEAISWHLCEVLGLDPESTKRIVFHEITEPAIKQAVGNPRRINRDLVNAQQARRVLDRLVGFELSPVLWKKLKPSLSAGRVQSVAVRLVVEREREIQGFEFVSRFRVVAVFIKGAETFKATLNKRFDTEEEAAAFLEACKASDFEVTDIQVKPVKKSPASPFTTSTLQQEASRKLSFSVAKTMSVAQRLYESGKITYMRTDSVNLSQTAIDGAAAYIIKEYGEDYSHPRNYTTTDSAAQEAHEAIRPTYLNSESEGSSRDEQRLYELIWKRTIASQMAQAELEKTRVKIDISGSEEIFDAEGEVLKFPGFLKVYIESTDDEEEGTSDGDVLLPAMSIGDKLNYSNIEAVERFNRPPARYTEASLVKKMEELKIGRPSTYAPTISTIQKRDYVKKTFREGQERQYRALKLESGEIAAETMTEVFGAEKAKLFPTDIGMLVNDFLMENFGRVMDYNFTAEIEKEFDDIAQGSREWKNMLDSFYKPFHSEIEHTVEHADRVTGERELGIDPKSGKPVIARLGRYGPMVQIGHRDDEEKPQFAKLREGQSIETIELDEALVLFELPRIVGTFEGEEMKANIGRYGPYILHMGKFVSIGKEQDPYTITEEEAIELIKAKREADKNKFIKEFEEEGIQILNGRWGPYIKQGRKNFRIPKTQVAEELTLEDCQAIIAEGGQKKSRKKAGK